MNSKHRGITEQKQTPKFTWQGGVFNNVCPSDAPAGQRLLAPYYLQVMNVAHLGVFSELNFNEQQKVQFITFGI